MLRVENKVERATCAVKRYCNFLSLLLFYTTLCSAGEQDSAGAVAGNELGDITKV